MSIELDRSVIKEMFPSTKTQTINKLITENSLTRLLNRLLDVDGYVITSEFPDSENINNKYDYIPITEALSQKNLEFCIRGYYFNLGYFENIISKIRSEYSLEDGDIIKAVIFIDDVSNPEYPELYGQDEIVSVNASVEDNQYYFPYGCDNKNVSDIKIYLGVDDVTPVSSELSVDSVFVTDKGYKLLGADDVEYDRITYTKNNFISSIALYRNDEPIESPNNTIQLKKHELTLFNIVDDDFVIPLSSIHRFSSLALDSVDGGEIPKQL